MYSALKEKRIAKLSLPSPSRRVPVVPVPPLLQIGLQYDIVTFVNMILGFARENRYKDVLVMFEGLETLMAANTRDGSLPMQARNQIGYRNCYHEALKGCEVCGVVDGGAVGRCGVVLLCYVAYRVDLLGSGLSLMRCSCFLNMLTARGFRFVCHEVRSCESKGRGREEPRYMSLCEVFTSLLVAVATVCCSQVEGNWQMARRILKSLHLQNMGVDVVAYGAAIGACGRKGR